MKKIIVFLLFSASLMAQSVSKTGFWLGSAGNPAAPFIFVSAPLDNVIQFGDGKTASVGNFNANVLMGAANIRSLIQLGNATNPGAPYVYMTAPSSGLLLIGTGTGVGTTDSDGTVTAGIVNARSVIRMDGTDATCGLGATAVWCLGVNTTLGVQGTTVVALGTSYATTFQGTNANVTNVTATGVIRSNTGFSVNGNGGVNTAIACTYTSTTVSGTTITYCSGITAHTFAGGIKTN